MAHIAAHAKAKENFLRLFPKGFRDPSYIDRERFYKVEASGRWSAELNADEYRRQLRSENFEEIAKRLLRVYQGLNLLGRFEYMALRDSLRSDSGAELLGKGIFDLIYGEGRDETRFVEFSSVLGTAPQEKTKLTKWPLQTVFPFLADPARSLFLKPNATKTAAERFGFELNYRPSPNWLTYTRLLQFGHELRQDLADWKPRDMIDVQSFIWVTTSAGYASELLG